MRGSVVYSDYMPVAAHCPPQSDKQGFQGHLMKIETPNGFVLNYQKMATVVLASRKQSALREDASGGPSHMLLPGLKNKIKSNSP